MIPASLQTLKDTARSVQRDAAVIERARDQAFYGELIAVAKANLGELWQYTNGKPKHYSWECPANGAEFEIRLPGHRSIYAHFGVQCSGRAYWYRLPYYGTRTRDVETEESWWMVSPPDRPNMVPTYYHTLGAALAAAED